MTVVLLLLFAVRLAEVLAAPTTAFTTADGRSLSLSNRQQLTTATEQRSFTSMNSASSALLFSTVATSRTPLTMKEQQKVTTVQRPVDNLVPAQKNMIASVGQTVTLPCRGPTSNGLASVTWTRPDLKTKNVLLFQDGQPALANQHVFFKNRVDLKDKQMKKGELSLVLKDVKMGDAGTYECRVKEDKGKPLSESISTVILTVPLPDESTDDSSRRQNVMAIALSVVILIVFLAIVTAVIVVIVRKCRRCLRSD